ncbi:O-antigen/teichoic acid export membrane protein [Rhodoblastus acidophilus]|uniref:oligosaccharide flippase family protein n=1 Tax=Rhodoblastus acidophilus TaxID=1074 RepID=UPI002225858F|nr:oligosaccharide flippase family protein [Rhodoblastus acidophilus]MCW2318377.1 O-antigen/teichoic acid export membrane protein [Rhodoblastus acidophilus]
MTPVQRSFVFSAVERYASLVILFLSTAALARLLSPEEFGVYAVVSALTTVIATSAQEFGGASYIIQKAALSETAIRTAFTITFVLSLLMGVALWGLADALGCWFGMEGVGSGVKIAALGFAISPFSTIMLALLRRDLMFGGVAAANLIGNGANATTSIALAMRGHSFLAPVWGQLAGAAAQAVYLAMQRRSVGIFAPSLAEHAEIVRFGMISSGVTLINLAFNAAPQLFLARLLGFSAVGLYSRAVAITQIFDRLVIQAISPVIMPALASKSRNGEDLKPIYARSISTLAAAHWPFLLCVAILAEPIVEVWLGRAWLPVAPLVRLLCAGSLALFAACLTYPILVATGHVRDALISSLISLPPSVAVMFAASFLGVEAVAASTLLTLPLQACVAMSYVGRRLGVGPRAIAAALGASALVAGCCGCAAAVGALAIKAGWLPPLAGLGVSGALVALAWLAALMATDHPLLREIKSALGRRLWFRREAASVPAGERPHQDVC